MNCVTMDHLIDQADKVTASSEFGSCLRNGDFFQSSHTSDFKTGTPVASLPGAWRCRVCTGTGWLGVSIRYVTFLFFCNPTIKVVTFPSSWREQAGCVLLPVFTCPGHECQDLLSLCDGMHMCTEWTSVYTLIRKS